MPSMAASALWRPELDCAVTPNAPSSSMVDDSADRAAGNTSTVVNPPDRLRSAGRRNPVEATAKQVTERVVDLLISALDVNEMTGAIDLNGLLDRVDINAVLKKFD